MNTFICINILKKGLYQLFILGVVAYFSINTLYAQSEGTATTLAVDGSAVTASLTANGSHWYKFNPSSNGIHIIETHGSTDTYMTLYQSNQTTVIDNDDDNGDGNCSKISSNLNANTWYFVKIKGYDSSTTGSYSIDVTGPATTVLYSPGNLIGSAGQAGATFSWTAPSSGTPTSYKIYWSYTQNGTYTPLNETYTTTNATVTITNNTSEYWFYVTAIYTDGESVPSNKVRITFGSTNQEIIILDVDGATANASLTANENDWYKFMPSVSGIHTIETHGTTDTYMFLYDSDQTTEITHDDDGGSGSCSLINSNLNANTWYYIKVKGYDASITGSYSINVSGPETSTFGAPLNLAATVTTNTATFTWDSPLTGSPTDYKLYRSSSINGTYTLISSTTTNRTASVSGLSNGTTYWFYVTAVYTSGESTFSNKVSITPGSTTPSFTNLVINGSAVNASLTAGENDWFTFSTLLTGIHTIETHGNTDTYMMLYQNDQSTIIETDDDDGSNNCSKIVRTLASGTQYFVKIRGYDSSTSGNYTIDVTGPTSAALGSPTNLIAASGNSEATLSWLSPTSGTPTSYKLYRSTSESGTYTLSGTYTTTSALVTGLTNSTTYWFYVTAVYSTGESDASNKISVTPTANQGITTLTVGGTATSASLIINENDWYQFYTSATGTHIIETHGNTDTHMTLYQNDQTTFIADDDDSGSGSCSKISNYLSANTWYFVKIRGYSTATTGDYTIDVTGPGTTTYGSPRNLTGSAGNGNATFNWYEPTNGIPTGYKLYSSTSENGTYSLAGTYTTRTATITGLTNSTNYWFYVTAIYTSGESAPSNKVIVTPVAPIYNPPLNLIGTAGNAGATLNWSAPFSGTPSTYKLYQSTSENGTYTLLNTYTVRSVTLTGLTNGTSYWFYVTANYPGGESAGTNKVNVIPTSSTQGITTLIVDAAAVSASLITNDNDWYKFTPSITGTHTIETQGNTDTYMTLYQSDQTTVIAQNDDDGEATNSKITRTLNSGTWYFVKINGINSSTTGNYSITVTGPAPATYNPPRNLTAVAGNGSATFSWDLPLSGTPTGYKLYQGLSEYGNYSALSGTILNTTTSINGLSNGTAYWFYVTAVYSSGESTSSNKISVTPTSSTQGVITLIVNGSATSSTLVSEGNNWYKFYASTTGSHTIETHGNTDTFMTLFQSDQNTVIEEDDDDGINNCSKITRTLNYGSWYFIKIRGYDTSTSGSYTIDVTGPTTTLAPPGNLTGSAGDGSAILNWSAPTSGSPTGYKLYRSLSEYGTYTLINTYTSNSASVTGLSNGTTYWFYVTATYQTGESSYSNRASITPTTGTLNPPRYLTITAGNGTASLNWSAPVSGSPNGYKLYQSLSENGAYYSIGTYTTNSVSLTGLSNGTTYWFYVTATYSTGESTSSNKVSATPNSTTSGITTLVVDGTPTSAYLIADGNNWYKFIPSITGTHIIETHGSTDTFMILYQSDQTTTIEENDDGGVMPCSKISVNLNAGTWYYVKIRGYSPSNYGNYTIDVTGPGTAALSPPLNLTGSAENGGASFSWSEPISGTPYGYKLYRSSSENGTYMLVSTVTNRSASTTGLTNGTTYWFYVTALYSTGESSNSNKVSVTPVVAALNPPRNLTVSAGDGTAICNWDAPTSGTPTSYKVYRSTSENGTYTFINTFTTRTASFTGLTNGTTYWLYVTAIYSTGESNLSNKASVTPVAANQGVTTLTVDGSAASTYLTANGTNWYKFRPWATGIHTIETHGYTDTYMTLYQSDQTTIIENDDDGGSGYNSRISNYLNANTWYYVKIRGYSTSTTGNYTIDVEGPATTALNTPRNLIGTAGNGSASFSWDAPTSGSPIGYKLYTSTSESGTYTASSTTYTDKSAVITTLNNGTTYWFYVTAVYSAGESLPSNKISVTPVTTALNSPGNLTASAGNGEASFSWSAPSSGTPSGYKLYWSTSENGTYTSLDRTYTTTSASIAILSNGSTYWFYVTAIYSSGESSPSNKVSVTSSSLAATLGDDQNQENKSSFLSPISQNSFSEDNFEISVYPNPFSNFIHINSSNNQEILSTRIYDMSGKMVYMEKGSKESINTSKLKKGSYIIVFQVNDNKTFNFKLIKSN